jgi:hypothetical protein
MLNHTEKTQTPVFKVERFGRKWPVKFETLTAVTHLLITKYILKLAGMCGFCNKYQRNFLSDIKPLN